MKSSKRPPSESEDFLLHLCCHRPRWIKLPLAIQTIMVIHRMLPLVFKFSNGNKSTNGFKWYQMVTFSKGIILEIHK